MTTSTIPRELSAVLSNGEEASISSPARTRCDSGKLETLLSDTQCCLDWMDFHYGEENIEDEGVGQEAEENRVLDEEEEELEEEESDIRSSFGSEEEAGAAPKPHRRQNLYCKYHGKCRHTSEDCDVIAETEPLLQPVQMAPMFNAAWTGSASYHTSHHTKKSRQQWKANTNAAGATGI